MDRSEQEPLPSPGGLTTVMCIRCGKFKQRRWGLCRHCITAWSWGLASRKTMLAKQALKVRGKVL